MAEKRLIDAGALDKIIEFYQAACSPIESRGNAFMFKALSAVKKMVADAPTIDAVVPVHGEWKDHYRSGIKVSKGVVSGCCDMWNERKSDYCPSCGAIMDGEAKEGDGK